LSKVSVPSAASCCNYVASRNQAKIELRLSISFTPALTRSRLDLETLENRHPQDDIGPSRPQTLLPHLGDEMIKTNRITRITPLTAID
jgi:hypothetical protein